MLSKSNRLHAAWVINNFSDSALIFVLVLMVYEVTSSASAAAVVFALQAVPAFLSPIAGMLADRLHRIRLVITANMIAAAAVATLLINGASHSTPIICSVALIYGLLARVVSAANSGIIRDMYPDEKLGWATGRFAAIDQAMMIVAPMVGVGVMKATSPRAVIVIVSVGLVLSVLCYAGVSVESSHTSSGTHSIGEELFAGFSHIKSTPSIASVVTYSTIALGSAGLATSATLPAIESGLGQSVSLIAVLTASQGIAAFATGMAAGRLLTKLGEGLMCSIGIGLFALGMSAFLWPWLPTLIAGEAVAGIGVTMTMVSATVVRQRLTPGDMQGRSAAAMGFLVSGAICLSTFLGAALLTVTSYRHLFLVVVIVCSFISIVAFLRRNQIS